MFASLTSLSLLRKISLQDGVGLPLASPDMLYKERTPKTNLRGSQSGGYYSAVQYHRRCCLSALCPLSLLPSPLRSALSRCSPLSPAPARRRRAHRRPPRASDALREGYGATHSWDIKDMGSLKKVSLSFSSDNWAHEVIVELVASWEV